jgi:hypothetical protein
MADTDIEGVLSLEDDVVVSCAVSPTVHICLLATTPLQILPAESTTSAITVTGATKSSIYITKTPSVVRVGRSHGPSP